MHADVLQVRLQDPSKEWTLHNAWFVRQLDFNTTFRLRELVQPVMRKDV
jgi:hypothetical protein